MEHVWGFSNDYVIVITYEEKRGHIYCMRARGVLMKFFLLSDPGLGNQRNRRGTFESCDSLCFRFAEGVLHIIGKAIGEILVVSIKCTCGIVQGDVFFGVASTSTVILSFQKGVALGSPTLWEMRAWSGMKGY